MALDIPRTFDDTGDAAYHMIVTLATLSSTGVTEQKMAFMEECFGFNPFASFTDPQTLEPLDLEEGPAARAAVTEMFLRLKYACEYLQGRLTHQELETLTRNFVYLLTDRDTAPLSERDRSALARSLSIIRG